MRKCIKTLFVVCFGCVILRGTNGCRREPSSVQISKEGFFRNVREYKKRNVTFRSRPIKNGHNYSHLIVGSPRNPYAGEPAIKVRLPNGEVINLAQVSISNLITMASSARDCGGNYCHDITVANLDEPVARWPRGTLRVQYEFWLFFIKDATILAFTACDYGWNGGGRLPAIGNPTDGKLYTFPLMQDQVIKVFGDPDSIREFLEE